MMRLTLALAVLAGCSAAPPEPQPGSTPAPRGDAWVKRHETIVARAKQGGFDVLFLGDSITEQWAGAGKAVWAERIAPMRALNAGISGDCTQHVLWRLRHGLLGAPAPRAT